MKIGKLPNSLLNKIVLEPINKYSIDREEVLVKPSIGEDCSELKMVEPEGFWSCYILHTLKEGNFKRIQYTDEIKKNIVEEHIHVKEGEKLIPFTGSNGTVGVLILRYDSMEEMLHKMYNMYDYITVEVE